MVLYSYNFSNFYIQIVGSLVDFSNEVVFVNNTDMVEGSLSILSFGQLRIRKGLRMTFTGNTGRYYMAHNA